MVTSTDFVLPLIWANAIFIKLKLTTPSYFFNCYYYLLFPGKWCRSNILFRCLAPSDEQQECARQIASGFASHFNLPSQMVHSGEPVSQSFSAYKLSQWIDQKCLPFVWMVPHFASTSLWCRVVVVLVAHFTTAKFNDAETLPEIVNATQFLSAKCKWPDSSRTKPHLGALFFCMKHKMPY